MTRKAGSLLFIFIIGAALSVGCSSLVKSESPASPSEAAIPFISIIAVEPRVNVSVEAGNFPPNTILTAYINLVGTQGVDGIAVGTKKTDSAGYLSKVFEIPAEMKGQDQLVIRLEGGSGYWSYNSFTNQ